MKPHRTPIRTLLSASVLPPISQLRVFSNTTVDRPTLLPWKNFCAEELPVARRPGAVRVDDVLGLGAHRHQRILAELIVADDCLRLVVRADGDGAEGIEHVAGQLNGARAVDRHIDGRFGGRAQAADIAVADVERAGEAGRGANLEAVAVDGAVIARRARVGGALRSGQHHIGGQVEDRPGDSRRIVDKDRHGRAGHRAVPGRVDLRGDGVRSGSEVVDGEGEVSVLRAASGERADGLPVHQEVDGEGVGIRSVAVERIGVDADRRGSGEVHAR